jgi:hypothetical protein
MIRFNKVYRHDIQPLMTSLLMVAAQYLAGVPRREAYHQDAGRPADGVPIERPGAAAVLSLALPGRVFLHVTSKQMSPIAS